MLTHMLIDTTPLPSSLYASSISILSPTFDIYREVPRSQSCLRTRASTAPRTRRGRTRSGGGTSQSPSDAALAWDSRSVPRHGKGSYSTCLLEAGHRAPTGAQPLPSLRAPLRQLSGSSHVLVVPEGR